MCRRYQPRALCHSKEEQMFGKMKTFTRIFAIIVIAQFIISSVPAHTFALKSSATMEMNRNTVDDVIRDLSKGLDGGSVWPSELIDSTTTIGGFTVTRLIPQWELEKKGVVITSPANANILYKHLDNIFSEPPQPGDTYVSIQKGKVLILAKENLADQTLVTAPNMEVTVLKNKKAYYEALLEYVSLITTQTGQGIELIEEKGDRFMSFFAPANQKKINDEAFTLGGISGIKHWYGKDEPYQVEFTSKTAAANTKATLMTFKESDHAIARGWSMIVQPKIVHLTFGFGTIGAQIAQAARKMGFYVIAINRSANEKASNAARLGIPLYIMKESDREAFAKAKIPVAGTMDELSASGIVELITDATDGKTKDPETGKEVSVARYNIKYIYAKLFPNAKTMFEGAEDPDIADAPFDSGALNKVGRSYAEFMAKVKSLFFPSCNTTGQGLIEDNIALNAVEGTLDMIVSTHRRPNDPGQKGKMSPDGTTFETDYHHGEDYEAVRAKFPEIMKAFKKVTIQEDNSEDVEVNMLSTDASVTHITKFHITEMWIVDGIDKATGKQMTVDMVYKYLSAEPRIALIKTKKFDVTSMIDVLQRNNIVHPFTPIVGVYKERTGRIKIMMANPQESVVIPNNMNGLHALTGTFETKASMRLVNDVIKVVEIGNKLENTAPLKSGRIVTAEAKDGGMAYLTLDDIKDFYGKVFLTRIDTNVELVNGNVPESEKMREALISAAEISDKGGMAVLVDHQDRPGDVNYKEHLAEEAALMSSLLGKPITYVPDIFGSTAINAIKAMKPGDIIMLKNVRAWGPETEKLSAEALEDSDLVNGLSPYIDVYVNDAFSVSHRKNVSVIGFANKPVIAGRLLEKEIKGNDNSIQKRVSLKPSIEGFGGTKIDDLLGLITKDLASGVADKIQTSGLLGQVGLMAQGYDLGKTTTQFMEKKLKKYESANGKGLQAYVKDFKALMDAYPGKIDVPVDVAFLNADGKRQEVIIEKKFKTQPITDKELISDIGTLTIEKYKAGLMKARSMYFKGPWGVYSHPELAKGSNEMAQAAVTAKKANKGTLDTGGGDTNMVFDQNGLLTEIDFYSLGGGAAVEYAEGKKLPGLVVVDNFAKSVLSKAEVTGINRKDILESIIARNKLYTLAGATQYKDSLKEAAQVLKKLDGTYALIFAPELSRVGDTVNAVNELTKLGMNGIKFALYADGEQAAANLRAIVGNDAIVVGESYEDAKSKLTGIDEKNMMLLRSPADAAVDTNVRQVVLKDMVTVGIFKAVKDLVKSEELQTIFSKYLVSLQEANILSLSSATMAQLLSTLEQGILELPADLAMVVTEEKAVAVSAAQAAINAVMDQV